MSDQDEENAARYTISQADYLKATNFAASNKVKWSYASFPFVMVLVCEFSFYVDHHIWETSITSDTVIVPFIIGVLINCVSWIMRQGGLIRYYRSNKFLQEEKTVALKEDGLSIGAASGQTLLGWDKIFKWKESGDFLLLYGSNHTFFIMPKRIEEQGFPLLSLREKLLEKVGKPNVGKSK